MGANENKIEEEFVAKLMSMCYEYRKDIHTIGALEENFRVKFESLNREALNGKPLTDREFDSLLSQIITADVFTASKRLREPQTMLREDRSPLQYSLVNLKDWCKNEYEVVRQLKVNTHASNHRYDVVILVNGLPLMQVELKDYMVSPRVAIRQIVDYKNDEGNGYKHTLMCFMQLFVVSNGVQTYYFANNNEEHFRFDADEQYLPVYTFADPDNRKVSNLYEFAEKVLPKCALGELISRYMVLLEGNKQILIMRPYQIYAVKAILNCIAENRGNGYIWHTTGSGKTLTSFKAATLLKENPYVEKCVFVVDRKDLDVQTREEFNKFQSGCVEENYNTETLVRRLLSVNYKDKVIVTTIQKLGIALDENSKGNYLKQLAPLRDRRMVFIFDECHRSQFGENHKAIKGFFRNAQLFGFTGTPIFEENASYVQINGTEAQSVTTKDVFEKCLHQYTITHAIEDKNVLRFHIDYFKPDVDDARVTKDKVVEEILDKHNAATAQRKFNALFATASINDAIDYYKRFKRAQGERKAKDEGYEELNICCVFTPPAEGNRDVMQLQEDLPQEQADNKVEPSIKKVELTRIIDDYNERYGTNFEVGWFDMYYRDVQQRIKNQQYPNKAVPHNQKVDITIVVDMLLTGFDSKYLNTLYVDKELHYHGLIQAFSRTNRILNGTKPYGNILDFRCQQKAVDKAMMRFSGKNIERAKQIWLVESAEEMLQRYEEEVKSLVEMMHGHGLECTPSEVVNLRGESAKIDFINTFKEVQRVKNQLDQYTDLTEEQKGEIETILPEEDWRGFKGQYLETVKALKSPQEDGNGGDTPEGSVIHDIDFELVLFASSVIDYDYIMGLIANLSQLPAERVETTKAELKRKMQESTELKHEVYLDGYIDSLELGTAMTLEEVREDYTVYKKRRVTERIAELAAKYSIDGEALDAFVDDTIRFRRVDDEALTALLPDRNWKERKHTKTALLIDLGELFEMACGDAKIDGLGGYVKQK